MKYCRALQINPHWGEVEFARAREWLLVGLFRQTNDPYDDIVRNTTFERRADVSGEMYRAVYRPPSRAIVLWPGMIDQE